MSNDKYNQFLEKLIEKTKSMQVKWEYLDENPQIASKEDELLDILGNILFDADNSFCFEENNTTVILYMFEEGEERNGYINNGEIYLKIIPATGKNIFNFEYLKYQSLLTRLLNIVRSQFPNSEDFIDSFLKN